MRLHRSSIFILTCFSGVGFCSTQAIAATNNPTPTILKVAQANPTASTAQVLLDIGSQGADVQKLQNQLQQIGYYNGVVDGKYGLSTKIAVAQFQKAKGLKRVDGIADIATRKVLQTNLTSQNGQKEAISPILTSASTTASNTVDANASTRDFLWWSILGLGTLGSIGAIIFAVKWFDPKKPAKVTKPSTLKALSPAKQNPITPVLQELAHTANYQENTAQANNPQTAKASVASQSPPVEPTSRLTKLNIVDELIQDLRSTEPTKRQKAIWDLGQQGDSRAIQPLVNLLIDADSQQRNLILAALSEINIRTLKPINKALAISMQDESPQVRQNAIRDLTRVYDMMNQMSQILVHALDDADTEVQATAKYALNQMNRMRNTTDKQSALKNSQEE
ncbi:peptidoglycan-binding protein [Nostoc sp. TCL26-01]|uniref:peptidoglycan-binding protein n=1 Tax=Nostoc sp. TCL26-01 TaxID=2576904 RepID=UPI0015BBC178|nr:peptidoglycan-binding protein [Nostoc sp. TCL26-01]QLE57192.1 peptidoglycan-binding protein [Nostoc sp. TCL26-01]